MKSKRIKASPEKLQDLLEEYQMLGIDAEIDGDELVVYYGVRQKKSKKPKNQAQAERWSKRERNFGYTRRQQ